MSKSFKEISISKIGAQNSGKALCVTLPKDLVTRMNLQKGDKIKILSDCQEIIIRPVK